jgi:hypothetical protein
MLVSCIGCGSGSSGYVIDESAESMKNLKSFQGTVVWEFDEQVKPLGLEDGVMFGLIGNNQVAQYSSQSENILLFNNKPVCTNLVKNIYAVGGNNVVYLASEKDKLYLMHFDGQKTVRIGQKSVNPKFMAEGLTKPACTIVWDQWNREFVIAVALGNDNKLSRFIYSPDGKVSEPAPTMFDKFIATPVRGYVIEKTEKYNQAGDLTDLSGKKLILRSCLLRWISGSKDAYFISNDAIYKFDGTNLEEIGRMKPNFIRKYFGIKDGKPFTLSYDLKNKGRLSVEFFGQSGLK